MRLGDKWWDLFLQLRELLHSSLGCGSSDLWVNNRCQESNSGHHWVPGLREGYWLESEWSQNLASAIFPSTSVLGEIRILNRELQEFQNAFVLVASTDVIADFVPVVLEHLQRFQQQACLLIGPVTSWIRSLRSHGHRLLLVLISLESGLGDRVDFSLDLGLHSSLCILRSTGLRWIHWLYSSWSIS